MNFLIIFFLLAIDPYAQATTFGPIKATRQIEEAPYIVRGTILDQWIAPEPHSGLPHTYWKMQIAEVLKGDISGKEIHLRQPGGQIGERGYYVPGHADFKINEDVVVFLQDTQEPNTKDVVGLSSGKYNIENVDGTIVLQNGLGMFLPNAHGEKMSLSEFKNLVNRVEQNNTEAGDEKIILNPTEDIHPEEHLPTQENVASMTKVDKQINKNTVDSQSVMHEKPVLDIQKNQTPTDRKLSGAKWFLLVMVVTVGIIIFLLR